MKEIFKDIPGYEGTYQVSNLGNVKSFKCLKQKLLKPSINDAGYFRVNLTKNKKINTIKIHKLVAITFLNHNSCGHKLVIDHINNIKTDNRLLNLQIVTNRYNSSKDRKNKTSKYIGVSYYKITKKWVSCIYINGKQKHLGFFKNEYDAHLAYQNALKNLE